MINSPPQRKEGPQRTNGFRFVQRLFYKAPKAFYGRAARLFRRGTLVVPDEARWMIERCGADATGASLQGRKSEGVSKKNAGNASRHIAGQGPGDHRAETETCKLRPTFGDEPTDSTDHHADRSEVGKAAKGVRGNHK